MRIFALIGGLFVLVLSAALIGPYFINWSDYRSDFEREASALLGMPVKVAGATSARLLPFPSITFEDVRVGPDETPMLVAERFSVDAELAPFLSGEILIFDMRMDAPVINVELDETGKPVWPSARASLADGRLPFQRIKDVTLEQAVISDGRMTIRDPFNQRQWQITNMQTTVGADSLVGPLRLGGEAVVAGVPAHFELTTGRISPDGFSLKTRSDWDRRGINILTQGRIDLAALGQPVSGDTPFYSGTFELRPDDDAQYFLVEGVFDAVPGRLHVEGYRGEFADPQDPYVVEGSFDLASEPVPNYVLTVKGNQVRAPVAEQSDDQSGVLSARLEDIEAVVRRLPLPTIAGSVEVDLPAIVSGHTTIRDIRFVALPDGMSDRGAARWRVKKIGAVLPGRTVFEGEGQLILPEPGKGVESMSFEGDVVLASRQPSGLAGWLGMGADERFRRLSRAGFEGHISLNADRQRLAPFTLVFDDEALTGQVERLSGNVSRPVLDIALEGEGQTAISLEAFYALVAEQERSLAVDQDINVALDLTRPVYGEVAPERLQLTARHRGDRIELDRVSAQGFFGAAVSATGSLKRSESGLDLSYDVSAVAPDGRAFAQRLADWSNQSDLKDHIERLADASPAPFADMDLTANGRLVRPESGSVNLDVALTGGIGGTRTIANVTIDGALDQLDQARITADATLQNADGARLVAQLGLPGALGMDFGMGEATIRASGLAAEGLSVDLQSRIGGGSQAFDGVLAVERTLTGDIRPTLTGTLDVAVGDAGPWIVASGLPQLALGEAAQPLAAKASLSSTKDGGWRFADLAGKYAENGFSGELSVSADGAVREFSGRLAIDNIDFNPLFAAFAGFEAEKGTSAFAESRLGSVRAEIDLTGDQFTALAGQVSGEKLSLSLSLGETELLLDDVEATLLGGDLRGVLNLQNTAGQMLINGQSSFSGLDMAAFSGPSVPQLFGAMSGSLTVTGEARQASNLLSSLSGTGFLSTDSLLVSGVNASGFGDLITRADAIGFEITPEQIRSLVDGILFAGAGAFEPVSVPVTISNGVARMPNVVTRSGGLDVRADVEVSLDPWAAQSVVTLSFDPGTAAIEGMSPQLTVRTEGLERQIDSDVIVAYITQRALEREQARIEALQARLLERQRLRRDLRYFQSVRTARLEREEKERQRLERERQLLEQLEQERLERQRVEQEAANEEKAAELKALNEALKILSPTDDQQEANPESNATAPVSSGNIFQSLEFGVQ